MGSVHVREPKQKNGLFRRKYENPLERQRLEGQTSTMSASGKIMAREECCEVEELF